MNRLFCRLCNVRIKKGREQDLFVNGLDNGVDVSLSSVTAEMKKVTGILPKRGPKEVNFVFVRGLNDTQDNRRTGTAGVALISMLKKLDNKSKNTAFIADQVRISKPNGGKETINVCKLTTAAHELAHLVLDDVHVITGNGVKDTNILQELKKRIQQRTHKNPALITMTAKQCKAFQNFK